MFKIKVLITKVNIPITQEIIGKVFADIGQTLSIYIQSRNNNDVVVYVSFSSMEECQKAIQQRSGRCIFDDYCFMTITMADNSDQQNNFSNMNTGMFQMPNQNDYQQYNNNDYQQYNNNGNYQRGGMRGGYNNYQSNDGRGGMNMNQNFSRGMGMNSQRSHDFNPNFNNRGMRGGYNRGMNLNPRYNQPGDNLPSPFVSINNVNESIPIIKILNFLECWAQVDWIKRTQNNKTITTVKFSTNEEAAILSKVIQRLPFFGPPITNCKVFGSFVQKQAVTSIGDPSDTINLIHQFDFSAPEYSHYHRQPHERCSSNIACTDTLSLENYTDNTDVEANKQELMNFFNTNQCPVQTIAFENNMFYITFHQLDVAIKALVEFNKKVLNNSTTILKFSPSRKIFQPNLQGQMNQGQMQQMQQMNQGQMNQMNQGQMNQVQQGQMNQGQMNQGQMNQGQMQQGQMNQGQVQQGQMQQMNQVQQGQGQ